MDTQNPNPVLRERASSCWWNRERWVIHLLRLEGFLEEVFSELGFARLLAVVPAWTVQDWGQLNGVRYSNATGNTMSLYRMPATVPRVLPTILEAVIQSFPLYRWGN